MSGKNNKKPFNDPGYPPYPPDEDIYNKGEEVENHDSENPDQNKPSPKEVPNPDSGDEKIADHTENAGFITGFDPENPYQKNNIRREEEYLPNEEIDPDEDRMGDDLDVPGSELDDLDEEIGEEDEENNYYSLGGDKNPEDNRDYTP